MILSCQNISKSFVTDEILKNVSFHIEENEKAAVVGINGAGKSTLLKIIMKQENPDEGEVTLAKDKTIGYLAQYQDVSGHHTIYEEVLDSKRDIIEMEERLRDMETQMNTLSGEALEQLLDTYHKLSHEFEQVNGYAYRSEVTGILKGLGFTEEEFDKKMSELSGGQKTRVSLARLLVTHPDIILLDEPPNHLDIESIQWLETFLLNYKGAVVIVAHDRYFLDRTVNRSFAFEDGCVLKQYEGGYTDYALKAGEAAQCNLSVQDGIITSGSNAESAANTDSSADGSAEAGGRAAYDNYRANRERKLKFSYKEKMEYEPIEQDILDLEEKLESLDNEMAANATNSKRLSELAAEREQTEADLEHKMERWEYLEELAEKINAQNEN